jgi:hypothetical protein
MQMKAQEDANHVLVDEAASRGARQVYHTGQGQDEHAEAASPSHQDQRPLHGLDSAWSCKGTPHRESGTRCGLRQTLEQARGQATRAAEGPRGDRLGDSVGQPGGLGSMGALGGLKGRRLIAGVGEPHRVDDAHPDGGQGPYRHRVAFAFSSLALIIGQGPGFLSRRLPGELVEGIAQGFEAGIAFVRLGILATLEGHRSRARKACTLILPP